MVIKDKVKQRRLERLRHLRESSEATLGNGSSHRSSQSAEYPIAFTSERRSAAIC